MISKNNCVIMTIFYIKEIERQLLKIIKQNIKINSKYLLINLNRLIQIN